MTTPSVGRKTAALVRTIGVGVSTFAMGAVAYAAGNVPSSLQNGVTAAAPDGASNSLPQLFTMITNTLVYVVGAISVVFLIIGGLRYVISNGNPKNVTAAKDTILYAIIGLVIAIIAYAAVNFVISRF